ncbi:MAG: hypothetical protein HC822_21570 [Oscillochloris sp.]|nr:hypothetical protein [Oscillochloris sp.]
MRILRFAGFTLLDYLRSGRIAVEIITLMSVYVIFFRRPFDAEYMFSVLGAFAPLLTLYTASALIGLVDRPQSYLLLVRGLSRADYLLGLFLAILVIVSAAYGTLCLAVAFLNRPPDLDLLGWIAGTTPLVLNVGLLAALMIMLSPLVFSTGWRLFVLALIAMAFSSNFIGGTVLAQISPGWQSLLRAVQALLGGPLVPALYGYELATTRDYSTPTAFANVFAQLSLLISLLGLALYSFSRRDLIFSSQ